MRTERLSIPFAVGGVSLLIANVLLIADLLAVDHGAFREGATAHLVAETIAIVLTAIGIVGLLTMLRQVRASRQAPELAARARLETQAAQTASEAKSRYMASLSHEIRSPLNAIYGYAQLIERDEGLDTREAAKVIRRCAEHLTSLVDALLDISQVEKGVLRLKSEVVEFAPFLDQIVTMLRPSAAAKGLTFEYVTEGRLPHFVRTDQSRLRQVLINLVSNAIKFTDRGSVTLRVSYRAQLARFEIADTGPGIALEEQERVFTPFERGLDETRPGIGLGLPIARAIVEILGGTLQLNSEPGAGATFTVVLMLSEVTGKLQHRTAGRHVTGYLGPRRTVLIAEDDPEQLAFIEHLLRSLEFDVIAASDGETAVALAADKPIDLAILDISMPGISGWQTAVRLRQTQDAQMRVLMLSGNSQEFYRPDFPVPVHDLFLVKPVEFDELIEAVGGLLKLSWTQAERLQATDDGPLPMGIGLNGAARDHLARLREFLRIGYARGIEEEIRQLQLADPSAGPLADKLIEALDRFDLAMMAETLDKA